jgi:hypothetical protein
MCWSQTSSDSSCELARTYSRLASGCAKAYSTDARIAASISPSAVDVRAGTDPGERHRQSRLALPPLAEVGDLDEAVVGVGEAALVDDQPGVDLTRLDRAEDLVVAQLHHLAVLRVGEPEEQERRRLPAGDRDAAPIERRSSRATTSGPTPWPSAAPLRSSR